MSRFGRLIDFAEGLVTKFGKGAAEVAKEEPKLAQAAAKPHFVKKDGEWVEAPKKTESIDPKSVETTKSGQAGVSGKTPSEILDDRKIQNYTATLVSSNKKTFLKPEEITDLRDTLTKNGRLTMSKEVTPGLTEKNIGQHLVEGKPLTVADFDKFIAAPQQAKVPMSLGLPRWLGGASVDLPRPVGRALTAVGLSGALGYVGFVDFNVLTGQKDGGLYGIARYAASGAAQEQADARIAEAGRDKRKALAEETEQQKALIEREIDKGNTAFAAGVAKAAAGTAEPRSPGGRTDEVGVSAADMNMIFKSGYVQGDYGMEKLDQLVEKLSKAGPVVTKDEYAEIRKVLPEAQQKKYDAVIEPKFGG